MVLFIVQKTKVLGMTRKSTEISFGKYKKYWRKNQGQGAHTLSTRVGGMPSPWERPLSCGPPDAPPTSTPTLYIPFHGEKKSERKFHRILWYGASAKP